MAELFFTGVPCRNGHIDHRYMSTGLCLTCVRERFKRNGWIGKNKERRKQHCKKYRDANREKTVTASLASISKNPHVPKAWVDANRGLVRLYKRYNKLKRKQARPSWVDIRELVEIENVCRRVSQETGITHHVDHIVPLNGKTVCGLDVPWNLQVIPAADNLRKSNKLLHDINLRANDMHLRHGLHAVTEVLRSL